MLHLSCTLLSSSTASLPWQALPNNHLTLFSFHLGQPIGEHQQEILSRIEEGIILEAVILSSSPLSSSSHMDFILPLKAKA